MGSWFDGVSALLKRDYRGLVLSLSMHTHEEEVM